MSYSTSIFQILKAIDISYEKNNFSLNETLDLKKLDISEQRLYLLLENLIDDGLIKGIKVVRSINGFPSISVHIPRLTTKGLIFLEENTSMKKAYKTLKEIRGWIPTL